jgi:hypothetical protein
MNNIDTIGKFILPDNIKSLFRSILIMQPDMLKIAETTFELNQFEKPKEIAKKLFTLFNNFQDVLGRGGR